MTLAATKKLNIEVFCAPHCSRCAKTWQMIKTLVDNLPAEQAQLHRRDVLEHLETAAQLGVRQTPTIVINGKIEFTGEPTETSLKKKLKALSRKPS